MVKIISDTATLYSPEEASKLGADVNALVVTVNGNSYKEYVDIQSDEFIDLLSEGHIPSTSQPAIGEVIETYEKYDGEAIINISMADGLSGTYQSALGARNTMDNPDNIYVFNSKTLCGPQRYMFKVAVNLAKEGKGVLEILDILEELRDSERSFLIPQDFDFLKRGGRLTPLAAKMGQLLRIKPILTLTPDATKLEKFAIGRTFNKSIDAIISEMKKVMIDNEYVAYVSHGGALEQAKKAKERILTALPSLDIKIKELSPAFITQGGPSCVAIQWIEKYSF